MTFGRTKFTYSRITLAVFVSVGCLFGPTPYVFAGDLLRGGAGAGVAPTRSSTGSGSSGSTAVLGTGVLPSASDRLARTTQALTAVKAMQDAARALAASAANNLGMDPNHAGRTLPNVPNGLGIGGLQVASGVPKDLANPTAGEDASLWQGAQLPTQTTSGTQTNVSIVQTATQALLNWTTFNVGKNTTLTFDQSAGGSNVGQWVAFNKVNDPSAVPSQILGSIKADGQVYIINPNGIIFGGTSQVNTHALVASSLPINDNLIARGLLNNPDNQFLFSSLALPAGSNGPTAAFTPAPLPEGLTQPGDVTVQAGAQISAPTSDAHVGGRVALIGSNVTNAGTISTPDGQVIMAAGQQVAFVAHSSSDPSLRGLDVYVGAVTPTSGTVTNAGLIDVARGAATVVGENINQNGFIDSSTSVALNGRIDLLANYNAVSTGGMAAIPVPFIPTSAGTVTLGADSVTRILPEFDSTETVAGALSLASQINLQGRTLHLASDAQIQAPSADVSLDAGIWNLTGTTVTNGVITGGTPTYFFAQANDGNPDHASEIDLDAGASIDVAGSQAVSASVKENIVAVQLRGSELADSPLQRDGALRGQTVQVDIRQTGTYNGKTWVGTPLADATGYAALVQRTVGELTTSGGTVKLNAGGAVKLQQGASVDVSGGWINYAGGVVQTTQVVSEGHVYDISQATPDRVYSGIYTGTNTTTDSRWGATQSSTNPLPAGARYEDGYAQGGAGGSLAISAPTIQVDGTLKGTTVAGPHQRASLPTPSALTLAFQAQDISYGNALPYFAPTKPDIVFGSEGTKAPANTLVLSTDLFTKYGFGKMEVDDHEGSITVPEDVAINLTAGGSLSLNAANLDIEGKVSAPGGTLKFEADDISLATLNLTTQPANARTPDAASGRGNFTLGANALLDVSGLMVDDRPAAASADLLPLATRGGSITIKGYNTTLKAGSTVDVSGGVAVSSAGKIAYGNAGSLAVSGGQDPALPSVIGGTLSYHADAQGYAGAGATSGAISLLGPLIQIGGTSTDATTLVLSPDFFSEGGFSTFTLTGLGEAASGADQFAPAVSIVAGTTIAPQPKTWLATTDATGVSLVPTLQIVGVRPAVNLTFDAHGVLDPFRTGDQLLLRGDLLLAAGAAITADPGSKVSLLGNTVSVLGSVTAPGGAITVTGGKDSNALFLKTRADRALTTVLIGSTARLSTAGTTVLTTDSRGYHTGNVLAGGSIAVSGNIVADAGAVLDVSGATDVLDRAPSYSSTGSALNNSLTGSTLVPTRIDSSAGSITLAGAQELFSEATLRGTAGGPSAQSGSLTVSSGRFIKYLSGTILTPLDTTLEVTQHDDALALGSVGIGQAVLTTTGASPGDYGHFAADSFSNGGFSELTLKGTVQFSGAVSIDAARSLTVGSSGVIYADAPVNLTAPYVALGQAYAVPQSSALPPVNPFLVGADPFHFTPSYGTGQLSVNAGLIDVGNLALETIGSVNLIADNGDVRGYGTLDLSGDLYIRAEQVYTPTATTFTIVAHDYTTPIGLTLPGTVKFVASGTRDLPLSAGGSIDVYATSIHQGGVLRAPLGAITLGWDGTGTAPVDLVTGASVPVAQSVALDAGSVTSVSAIDPTTGQPIVVPYGVNLNGTAWIDPTGTDITLGGVPAKSVSISANELYVQDGSKIDLNGGGDLYAYRFVAGVGGSTDILASTTSFAVIPGYQANYAPDAAYASSTNFGSDAGYVNGTLKVGDRIYLDGSTGLPAGVYTLLPARYALLPGAFLVTPKSAAPTGAATVQPDGSSLVSGYRFNDLDKARTAQPLYATFEVAAQSVVKARAQYDSFSGNAFLSDAATANDLATPRLPVDAGQLVLLANSAMTFRGLVSSTAPTGGRGGLVDIGSSVDIVIGAKGGASAADTLFLDASDLASFSAQSLLIGGVRSSTSKGEAVDITAGKIVVDNAGTPLTGSDIVLVASSRLTLTPGAEITATGSASGATDPLVFGSATEAGSGNGAVIRVSDDPTATITRAGVDASTDPAITLAGGVKLSGASVMLDSTSTANLDSKATLSADAITLAAGRVSLQFANPGPLQPEAGLIVAGGLLQGLQSVKSLTLSSYSSIDVYGVGQLGGASMTNLTLHTPQIRGFNTGGGTATLAAGTLLLDNVSGAAASSDMPGATATGTLNFSAGTLEFGANDVRIDQFARAAFNATNGVEAVKSGSVAVHGAVAMTAPTLASAAGVNQTIAADGSMTLASTGTTSTLTSGTAAQLTLIGSSIAADANVVLPSGSLTLHATSGDLTIGGASAAQLDVSGTAKSFYDAVRYTDGGQINLMADAGAITVASNATLNVAAASGGGDAGTLAVSTPQGTATLLGSLRGSAGSGGTAGTFKFDAGSVPGGDLTALNAALDAGGFTALRSLRVRTGDLTLGGTATAHDFSLSADQGSITITGTINAAGATGGTIDLTAHGSVTLANGAVLDAAGQNFDSAGKGGSVDLSAGAETNGVIGDATAQVKIANGSTIDLSVASNIPATTVNAAANTPVAFPTTTAGNDVVTTTVGATITFADGTTAAIAANTPTLVAGGTTVTLSTAGAVTFAGSAARGDYTGTLHLRAPQTADGKDVQVASIDGTIRNASAIVVEGYKLFDLTGSGAITSTVENAVRDNGAAFAGGVDSTGATQAGSTTAIRDRLLANQGGASEALAAVLQIEPGAEIINRTGDLTLASNWDLSSYRFGAGVNASVKGSGTPGTLTLRAAGNLVFGATASLSDGFDGAAFDSLLLAPGAQSWSYRLTAGADLTAADFHQVTPLSGLASGSGSVLLGQGSTGLPEVSGGDNLVRSSIIPDYFQTIRTGTGDIDISAGRDVLFLNPLSTIYTAGTQAPAMADFDLPKLNYRVTPLGATQTPVYDAQYTLAGGNVSITAQGDIAHYLETADGRVDDSTRELPTNWLYRRGYIDATTGLFGVTHANGEVASTTWWTDFSNFYEGVATLGGGNVALIAGGSIHNVDAATATNARMPQGQPDAGRLVELGGGDLLVRAGRDIDGGVYYVERGQGTLQAGGAIMTNATRAALLQSQVVSLNSRNLVADPVTWLPTTLFLGKGSFDVTAGGDVLLGPVANPFLLPQGINNSIYEKSYFSTYAATDAVNITSLAGAVTVKGETTGGQGSLEAWYSSIDLFSGNAGAYSQSQPWLRILETDVSPFKTASALMPGTLRVTAFSGDINLVGQVTLAPSATGTVDLISGGSINGVQLNGIQDPELAVSATNQHIYTSSSINLSDADPSRVPGVNSPLSLASQAADWQHTPLELMDNFNQLFAESGSTTGAYAIIQAKQALHDASLLHANDPDPVRLYAADGDISGLTFFSPKSARVIASEDVTDISLYAQNLSAQDVTLVSAGRDLILYDPNSPLRVAAVSTTSILSDWSVGNAQPASGSPTAGDIQLGGPGTLELLAGRNFDVGVGPNNADGTGVGVKTIGNARNPFLPFGGADIFAGAGIGAAVGLDASKLDFTAFIGQFLDPSTAGSTAERYLTDLGALLGMPGASRADIWQAYKQKSAEEKDQLALDIFYLVLRDAGRDHNDPTSAGFRNYGSGYAAIKALFPGSAWAGDISLTSREIKTAAGGNIDLFAPGGELTVGFDISGNQAADQGILTEHGGSIAIFTHDSVNVGTSRIFTLRGGNEIIWSSAGNIAAGASSKTVQSAPPTRVLIDPQSGDVQTDLAGLATGGGIGVLATVADVPPGDVDLIAPTGTIDAGDAGIRVSGNINIAAVQVLNASNVQSSGAATGVPATTSAPSLGGALASAASTAASASSAATEAARQSHTVAQTTDLPSIITVEVLGYGGGDAEPSASGSDTDQKKKDE